MHDYINLYKKCYNNYCYCPCSCHCLKRYSEFVCDNGKYRKFCEENNIILKSIAKSYFNVEYIKVSYLLQKVIKLDTSNIYSHILVNIKQYNEHIKDIINNLKSTKDIYSICLYLMNICCERYFRLSQDEYLEIIKFIDNNIDIILNPRSRL